MSGGRFLVSLCEVTHSERILAIDSLLREGVNFWEEDLRPTSADNEDMEKINKEVSEIACEIMTSQLTDESREVATTIAGYVAKKLYKRTKCTNCQRRCVATSDDVTHCHYLNLLSRGGLTCPSTALADFVCQLFSALDAIESILQKHAKNISIRKAAELVISGLFEQVSFTCNIHDELGKKWAIRTIVNIFFNNHQKISNDTVRKDQVKDFKSRQRKLNQ